MLCSEMGEWFRVLTVLTLFLTLFDVDLTLKHKLTPCEKSGYDNCKCLFPDGQGIDLTSISKSTDFGWVQCDTAPHHSVNFKPCGSLDLKNVTNDCEKSSICLNVNDTVYRSLGKTKDARLLLPSISGEPYLEFKLNTTLTTVQLKCNPFLEESKLEFLSTSETTNVLRLSSSDACLKKWVEPAKGGGNGGGRGRMGVFSVLAIVGAVLLLAYFIGGFLVLRYIKGARGVETIPNHNFWLHLPTHCKNGVLFLLNGCQNPVTYETI